MKLSIVLFSIRKYANLLLLSLISSMSIISFSQPVVVTHPNDTSVCVESSASFRIVAVNTSAYQWQENDGVGWYDLTIDYTYAEGQFTPDLIINDANIGLNNYLYRCVVSDINSDTDTSNSALFNVYEPPIITNNPQDDRVCKNDIAIFSVIAINGGEYQWQEFSGTGWISIEDNSFYSGSQSPDLEIFTTTGMNGFKYRCVVTNVTCPDTSDFSFLYVDPTPIIYTMTGGGEYCEGGTGAEIGLDNSEIGISYDLVLDGISTGIVLEGTGEPLNFGLINQPGMYTAKAYNQFTGCSILMSSSVNIIIDPPPDDYPVQGGGSICEGEDGLNIFLLNSQSDVSYQLFLNAQYTGIDIHGTGFAISFGEFNQNGFYTVLATNQITSCSKQMSGNAEVIVNSIPITNAGDDIYITQGSSTQLSGSATNGSGSYSFLWEPSYLCQNPQNQSTLTNELNLTTEFSLTTIDLQTQCISDIDKTIVFITGGELFASAGASSGNICLSDSVVLSAFASGGTGNYSYSWTSNPTSIIPDILNPVVYPIINTSYFLEVFDGIQHYYDTIAVQISPKPTTYNILGGGDYCQGEEGKEIKLNGSQNNIEYQLFKMPDVFITELTGSGSELNFGNQQTEGDYFVRAINNTACSQTMAGQVNISINHLPVAIAGPDKSIAYEEQVSLEGDGSGGSGLYLYSWSPEDSLINPNIKDPFTIPLHKTTMFELKLIDAETNCVGQIIDNEVVFVSGGTFELNLLSSKSAVCPEEQFQLFAMATGGSGQYTYTWVSEPQGFSSSIYNPIILEQYQTTIYTVTVNDGFNTISKSIVIQLNNLPLAFELSGGGEICPGEYPDEFILQSSEINTSYQLIHNNMPSGLEMQGNGYALNFGSWNDEGSYYIRAENNQTICTNQMANSVNVVINEIPIANSGYDQLIFEGSSTLLNGSATGGSGSYSYSWSPANILETPNNQNTQTNILNQTTLFTLNIVDLQSQCSSLADTVFVYTKGGNIIANANSSSLSTCIGETVSLIGTGSGGSGNFIFSWTSSPEGFYSNDFNPSVSPIVTTKYYLDIYDGQSHAYDSLEIIVNSIPQTYDITGGGEFCQGQMGLEISLSGSQTNTDYTLYQLPETEINTLTGTGQILDFGIINVQGSYYITANKDQGCAKQMNGEVNIQQNSLPLSQAGQDINIEYGSQATLNGNANGGSGSYLYNWTPVDSLINSNSQNPLTVALHATTLFNLSVTDAITGCVGNEDDQSVVFVSGGNFIANTTVDNNLVCADEEIQLFCLPSGGSGNYSYLWESIPSGFASTENNPFANPLVSTVYYVSISDGTTIINDSVAVNVNPAPISFNLLGGGEYCANGDGVELSLSNSEIGVEYNLFNTNGFTGLKLTGNNASLSFGQQTEEGEYFVIAENILSLCSVEMNNTATIIMNEIPDAVSGLDQNIQSGETTQLYGNGNWGSGTYLFNWSPDYLLANANDQNPFTVELTSSTNFLLNVTDNQTGCISETDSMIVYVVGGPLELTVSASEISICQGVNSQLNALASGGNGDYQYSWTSGFQDFVSDLPNPIITPTITKWYFIELTDGSQTLNDSILIVVNNPPNYYQINGGGELCQGDKGLDITLSGSETNTIYQLLRDANIVVSEKIGNGNAINFGEFNTSGTYTSRAAYIDTYCDKNMIGSAVIIQNPLPIANAGPDKYITPGINTNLNGSAANGSGSYFYDWTPVNKLINPSDQSPTTIPLNQSTLFNLKVTDQISGCESNADGAIVFVTGGQALGVDIVIQSTTACPGEQSTLIAIPTGGNGSYNYYWTSNPSGFISSSNEININPEENTWFIVQVSDGDVIVKDSVAINTLSVPTSFNLSGGGGYCPSELGVNIYLDESETGVSYSLYNNAEPLGINMAGTGSSLNFGKMISEGNYSIMAVGLNLCTALMNNSVQVVQNQKPTKFQLHGGGTYCDNDPSLGILLESSEIAVNYELYRDAINTGVSRSGNGLPISFTQLTGNGIFTVTATNSLSGCFENMSGAIPLIINESPNITISGDSELCLGDTTILTASGGVIYFWNTFPVLQTPSISVSPEYNTVYAVTSTNNHGCSDMESIEVNVYDRPEISLVNDLISYSVICYPDDLKSYEFYHGDKLIQNGTSNVLFYGDLSLDADTVTVVGISTSGCSDITSIFLDISEIPNAFTPDGDGKNDRFMIGRDISIYSRWGKEIYNGTDGWDGYYKGKIVAPGTYYYVNYVHDTDGNTVKTNKGSVTLVIR